jgi:hypothetical protein
MKLKTQATIEKDIVKAREARDLAILNEAVDAGVQEGLKQLRPEWVKR